jgi:hypothetical protein
MSIYEYALTHEEPFIIIIVIVFSIKIKYNYPFAEKVTIAAYALVAVIVAIWV